MLVEEKSAMFGQYKRINNKFVGVLTGKGLEFEAQKCERKPPVMGQFFRTKHAEIRQG